MSVRGYSAGDTHFDAGGFVPSAGRVWECGGPFRGQDQGGDVSGEVRHEEGAALQAGRPGEVRGDAGGQREDHEGVDGGVGSNGCDDPEVEEELPAEDELGTGGDGSGVSRMMLALYLLFAMCVMSYVLCLMCVMSYVCCVLCLMSYVCYLMCVILCAMVD